MYYLANGSRSLRDEAAHNLSTLKFSQSTRSPDPADPTRILTTTTTTTFSMTRDMAKGICQYFMDARLIENAVDRSITQFKDRGVYVLTPKGLHILERFITKNGISAGNLLKVFAEQPICMRLLHLERRPSDDEILVTRPVLELLFRRFVGKQPNIIAANQLPGSGNDKSGKNLTPSLTEADRALGVSVWKHSYTESTAKTVTQQATADKTDFVFSAVAALEWLNDLTTIVGRDEAGEVAAHFVRCGFIALVPDKTAKAIDPSKVTVVRGAGHIKGQVASIVGYPVLQTEESDTDITTFNSRSKLNFDSAINVSTKSLLKACALPVGKQRSCQIDRYLEGLPYRQ